MPHPPQPSMLTGRDRLGAFGRAVITASRQLKVQRAREKARSAASARGAARSAPPRVVS